MYRYKDKKNSRIVLLIVISVILVITFVIGKICQYVSDSASAAGVVKGVEKQRMDNPNSFVSECGYDYDRGVPYNMDGIRSGAKVLYDKTGIQLYVLEYGFENVSSIQSNADLTDYTIKYIKENIPNSEYIMAVVSSTGPVKPREEDRDYDVNYWIYNYFYYGDKVVNYLTDSDLNQINYIYTHSYNWYTDSSTRDYEMWKDISDYIVNGYVDLGGQNNVISKTFGALNAIFKGLGILGLAIILWCICSIVYLSLKIAACEAEERGYQQARATREILEANIRPIDNPDTEALIREYSNNGKDIK